MKFDLVKKISKNFRKWIISKRIWGVLQRQIWGHFPLKTNELRKFAWKMWKQINALFYYRSSCLKKILSPGSQNTRNLYRFKIRQNQKNGRSNVIFILNCG
jgi:hypothetical protein